MQAHKQQLKKKMSKLAISSSHGLSLIELMIAISISLILMAGIISIFVNSKNSYRLQQDSSVMQENSRTLLNMISSDLRMADHWGGVSSENVDTSSAFDTAGSCDTDLVNQDLSLVGYEGAATPPLAGCIDAADYVANTDVIVIRYADGNGVSTNAELNSNSTLFVKAEVGRRATIDTGTALYAITGSTDVIGVYNYPYKIVIYFVRPCSVKSGTVCTSSDDAGDPIPTLTRLTLNGSNLTQEPLIEGIEQLQFEYGLMNAKDSVEQFKKAEDMVSSDWVDVGSVRIGMVARANSLDIGLEDTAVYSFPDPSRTIDSDDDFTPSGNEQKYRRKQFIKTVNIRNRVRS